MRQRSTVPWTAALLIAVVLAVSAAALGAANRGERAPDFTLNGLDGRPVTLSAALQQRVIVLGLFHICDPCRKQGVELQQIAAAYAAKGVGVIGVNTTGDSEKTVREFLASFPIRVSYPYLLDPGRELERSYQVRMTPSVVIIDRTGTIRFRSAFAPAALIRQKLDEILG